MKIIIILLIVILLIPSTNADVVVPTPSTNDASQYPIVAPEEIENNTVYSNQSDYWGPYYYTLFADYPNWNEAYSWGPKWLQGTPNWIYNDSTSLYFNTSQLSTTYFNATESLAVAGTVTGGTLSNTAHPNGNYDSVTFNFTEAAGSPGLDLRVNFTDVDDFSGGVIRYRTSTLFGDAPIIQLWDYDDSDWEDYPVLASSTNYAVIEQSVFDVDGHLQNGIVQMRLYKASNGNTNNDYEVDWLAVFKGFGVPAGEEVDPYSWHRDIGGEGGNFTTTGNVSAGVVDSVYVGNFDDTSTDYTYLCGQDSAPSLECLRFRWFDTYTQISSATGLTLVAWNVNFALADNYKIQLGTGTDSVIVYRTTGDYLGFGGASFGDNAKNFLFGSNNNINYGRATDLPSSDHATIWLTSDISWATNSTQRGYITHNGTNFVFGTDAGSVSFLNETSFLKSISVDGNITSGNLTIWQNSTTVNINGGGKDVCFGTCV